jgi:AraC family ethanolamine operon transcriptional activator
MSELNCQLPIQLLSAEFADVEQMCEAVRSWDLDFLPLAAPIGLDRVGAIDQRRYGPSEIGHASFSVSIEQRGAPPDRAYTFGVLEPHMRRLWWRGRDVDSGTVLVFPVGSELHSISGPDFDVFTISVKQESIAAVCERFGMALPPARLLAETFRPPPRRLCALRQNLHRLMNASGPGGYLSAQHLVEELVVVWLRSSAERTRNAISVRSRDLAIRRCLERIEQADWTELSPAVLCEIGGVGERTVQYAFRERFGLTPGAFLKARRLAAVRERLLRADQIDETVGDISAALGFWHPGHFAADYRRAFGEVPSETLRRARSR